MKYFMTALILTAGLFVLTGCFNQQEANAKMAKGCEAGAKVLAKETLATKKASFGVADEHGPTYRMVTIDALRNKGEWSEEEVQYSCVFNESWVFFGSSHKAVLIKINVNGRTMGRNKDGKIEGELSDFMALTDAVDGAMDQ